MIRLPFTTKKGVGKMDRDKQWRLNDLVNAWRHSQSEVQSGRCCSIVGALGRREILSQAREEDLEQELKKIIFKGAHQ
jgi:hypothetical protein